MEKGVWVTALSLFLSGSALLLLTTAIFTDHWYEMDTRRHRADCERAPIPGASGGERRRVMPISNLPLRERGKPEEPAPGPRGPLKALAPLTPGPGPAGEQELLESWHSVLGLGVFESDCARPLFATYTGLWRKCYHTGIDRDIDQLISKGKIQELMTLSKTG
ncbi:transmembrane protein 178A-like [Rhincodon typus]|uniref:transmembrane protein 178A-like n=1 Tax=Rhincodon typus TaxID=259920 RepID=UPI0020306961|nr:transmembrane protein 178A-like [Rhincodon typus]